MNLWAKRIGQLAVIPVALFFFSCEDEAGVLGYKNPNPKFEASYIEIPVESSVLLLDSQRTSNFVFSSETNRLLLGKYVDSEFGTLTADAYTQFFTTSATPLPADVTYDSVSVHLLLDFYNYGSRDTTTTQSVSIYELDEDLLYENRKYYFNKSEAQVKSIPLGSKNFRVNPDTLDAYAAKSSTKTVVVKVPIDKAFGQRIFDKALLYRNKETSKDSTFKMYEEFIKIFKGIAVKVNAGDKIIGLNTNSAIRVHYHTPPVDGTPKPGALTLSFAFVTNFSQIKNDRSGTDLSGLTQFATDYQPADGKRYIQSGTGVYTKLDFKKFFEFCDTIPNIIITSANLVIDSVEQSSLAPPGNLILKVLQANNTVKKVRTLKDTTTLGSYNPQFRAHTGALAFDVGSVIDNDLAMFIKGDQTPFMTYSSTKKSYNGNFALFFQQLSMVREDLPRFQDFVLNPSAPAAPNSKSVNRVVFPKGSIKLKVYYTKPTTPLN